ncbi:SprT family zinc-dependent metalloprotease [uncultured Nitratireductor sp.]|uniref:M48 family metallopeptidase n=1 Tax=uncultured Nitratireductor sp. TaxID=520953 RepID=UPI0025CCFD92|nr:SprT family zinc-dependent metalloprotease [uncultured Nitratireductor sp.]
MTLGFLNKMIGLKVAAPPAERVHRVAGRELPLRIVENARARRLTLRIEPGGRGLRVTVPPGLSRSREVEDFLNRHAGWLEEKLKKLPERPLVRPGIKIPVRGAPHLIVHEPGRRGAAHIATRNGEAVLLVHGDLEHLPRRVADFLKREAKRDIEALVAKHTVTVGRRARAIRFRDTKSRWGSCTSDGVLSFSWRIMMAPPLVIDYLVAHEVAHLREMNHGARFWRLCRELCPETDRCKDWLKRNGTALQAIGFE